MTNMRSRKAFSLKLTTAGILSMLVLSCTSESTDIDLADLPSSISTDGAVIEIQVSTQWEGSQTPIYHNFQETSADVCFVSATSPVSTCTVSIPEYQLHRSAVIIEYVADGTVCGSVAFTPYRYLASTNAAYVPPGETTAIDCSDPETEAGCWGGMAPSVVPDFPTFTGVVQFPTSSETTDITGTSSIDSSFNFGYWDAPDKGGAVVGSNRMVTNDFTGALGADEFFNGIDDTQESYKGTYGGATTPYADYTFDCRDNFGEDPVGYLLTLEITDDDGTTNNYNTFKEY